jgi:hypothetical protein
MVRLSRYMNWTLFAFLLASVDLHAQSPSKPLSSPQPTVAPLTDSASKNSWNDPITWFTAGLLLVGGLQVVVYWKQKGLMEKSLGAAKDAAEAARQSAAIAMNAQSARVAIFRLEFGPSGASNWDAKLQSPSIEVMLKNYGPTTAFVESVGLEVIWGVSLPSEPGYTHAFDVEPETVVAPQETYTLRNKSYRPMIPSKDVEAIKEQKMFIWVYGHLQYLDVLDRKHITRFCKQLLPSAAQPGSYQFATTTTNDLYTNSG